MTQESTCKSISFSEDAKLLQEDLPVPNVSKWSVVNNMSLHDDKFVYVNFNDHSKNFLLANLPFYKHNLQHKTSGGNIIHAADSVTGNDLGITFTDNIN